MKEEIKKILNQLSFTDDNGNTIPADGIDLFAEQLYAIFDKELQIADDRWKRNEMYREKNDELEEMLDDTIKQRDYFAELFDKEKKKAI